MSKTPGGYECNVCREPKRQTNHWWKGYFVREIGTRRAVGILIVPWHVLVEVEEDVHLCGESCAAKQLSGVMTKPTELIPADAPPPAVQVAW